MRFPNFKTISMALLASLFAVPAMALEPCGEAIVDQANLLDPAAEARVEAAALDLQERLGITVRVRTSHDAGTHDRLVDRARQACDAWGGEDFATVWIATNPKGLGIYLSPRLQGVVSIQEAEAMADEHIVPHMGSDPEKEMDPATGIIAGLAAVEVPLRELLKPTSTTLIEAERNPLPWVWLIAGLALLAAALFLLLFVVLPGRRSASKMEARFAGLAGLVEQIDMTNTWLANMFGEEAAPKDAPNWVSKTLFAEWRSRYHAIHTAGWATNVKVARLRDNKPGINLAGYWFVSAGAGDEVTESLEADRPVLEKTSKDMLELRQQIEAEERLSTSFAATRETAGGQEGVFAKAKARIAAIAKQGFTVTSMGADLATARAKLGDVDDFVSGKRYGQANEKLAEAEVEANAAAEAAEALPVKKSRLLTTHQDLFSQHEVLLKRVPSEKSRNRRLGQTYAETSIASVKGNGIEAGKRLVKTGEMLNAASALIEDQDEWAKAEQGLAAIAARLDVTTDLLGSIGELETALETALKNARSRLEGSDGAVASVATARTYLSSNSDRWTEKRSADLDKAERCISQAKAELDKKRPDPFAAHKYAREADDLADGVYEGAVREQAAIDRERRRIEEDRDTLLELVASRQRFGRLHSSDLGWQTEEKLRRAGILADTLRAESDHDIIAELNADLQGLIDDAYDDAVREFEAAESVREAARAAAREAEEERRNRQTTILDDDSDDDSTVSWGSSSDDDSTVSWGGDADDDPTVGW